MHSAALCAEILTRPVVSLRLCVSRCWHGQGEILSGLPRADITRSRRHSGHRLLAESVDDQSRRQPAVADSFAAPGRLSTIDPLMLTRGLIVVCACVCVGALLAPLRGVVWSVCMTVRRRVGQHVAGHLPLVVSGRSARHFPSLLAAIPILWMCNDQRMEDSEALKRGDNTATTQRRQRAQCPTARTVSTPILFPLPPPPPPFPASPSRMLIGRRSHRSTHYLLSPPFTAHHPPTTTHRRLLRPCPCLFVFCPLSRVIRKSTHT